MALVMSIVLALQLSLMPGLRLAAASGDLMLLFALTVAMVGGPERGALAGFCVGLTFDLFLTTPFGLSALTYCLGAYMIGRIQVGMLRHSALLPVFTVALGTAVTVVLYALLARVFGQAWVGWGRLWRVVLVESGFSLFFAPISLPVCRWAMAGSLEARSASV
ncbi:MAG: rod shape-determining protein MreD [Acidimicrobiia bacterium]|nr:rod shape-determining protein MreD [Acidimicrobiia bacterium]